MENNFCERTFINGSKTIEFEKNIASETVKDDVFYFLNYFLDAEYYFISFILIISLILFVGAVIYFCIKTRSFGSAKIDMTIFHLFTILSILFFVISIIHLIISVICTSFSLDIQLLNLYETKMQINFYICILLTIVTILPFLRVFFGYKYFESLYKEALLYAILIIFSYCLFQYLPYYLISFPNNFNIFYILHIKIFLVLLTGLESLSGYYVLHSILEII